MGLLTRFKVPVGSPESRSVVSQQPCRRVGSPPEVPGPVRHRRRLRPPEVGRRLVGPSSNLTYL